MKSDLLRSKMTLLGYNDQDLAKKLGLSKSAVSRRLSNHILFNAAEIQAIKEWLRLTDKEVSHIFLA